MQMDPLSVSLWLSGLDQSLLADPSMAAVLAVPPRWVMKAFVMGAVSLAPGGASLYRRVQDRQAQRRDDADEMLERAIDLVALYRGAGGCLEGKKFLEVGTGWCPWVPLVLRLGGAGRIVTLDINPWLSHQTAVKTTKALLHRIGHVSQRMQIRAEAVSAPLEAAASTRSLQDWLASTGITYSSGTGIREAGLPAGTFDGILSSNVLEHVTPAGLTEIHRESARLLRPGGLVAHRFNPADHFSFSDASITSANFLQFSEAAWKWIGGSGLAYHNRLRCPQHRRLIEEAGLTIEHCRTRPDPRARMAVEAGGIRVHPDFAGMSADDLTDDYMWAVARRRESTTPSAPPA